MDLIWPKKEFIKLVKTWDRYDPKKMNVTLNHVKPTKLPSELKITEKSGYEKVKKFF